MISIVLPTYNGEKYLADSIDSILAQTCMEWELIVVDDCSTDHTSEIAEGYAVKDKRIKIIHNEKNRRLPASLNIGFGASTGEYLTWTSDDNKFYPDALEVMKDFLDEHQKCPMVCAGMNYMDETGVEYERAIKYNSQFMYYNDTVGACFMYRREVLEAIGGYDEKLFCVEDYDYWLRVLKYCGEIRYIDGVHYAYRVHPSSLTATKWLQIKTKLNEMRVREFDYIYPRLKSDMELFSGLYFDMLITDALTPDKERTFRDELPRLDMFTYDKDDTKDIILYGAGQYGDKAYELVGDRAVAYADKDVAKLGDHKNGLPIISYNDMIDIADTHKIVLSIDSRWVYGVASGLYDAGIRKISSFQHLMQYRIRNK